MEIIEHGTPEGAAKWREAQVDYIMHRFPSFNDKQVNEAIDKIGPLIPGNAYSIALLNEAMNQQTPGDSLDNKSFLVIAVPSFFKLAVGFEVSTGDPVFDTFETIVMALVFTVDGEEVVMPVMASIITMPVGALVPNKEGIMTTIMLSDQDGIGAPVSRA